MKKTLADKAKKYYDRGLWTEEMLFALVNKDSNGFTADEFKKITGKNMVGVTSAMELKKIK